MEGYVEITREMIESCLNDEIEMMYQDSSELKYPIDHFKKTGEYEDFFEEYLKRYYNRAESNDRLPKLSEYYKNYHMFFCRPIFRNFTFFFYLCGIFFIYSLFIFTCFLFIFIYFLFI